MCIIWNFIHSFRSIVPLKAAKVLQNDSISSAIVLHFDEMYLQKSEKYVGGETCGVGKKGNLHRELICFMIVWLKKMFTMSSNLCQRQISWWNSTRRINILHWNTATS